MRYIGFLLLFLSFSSVAEDYYWRLTYQQFIGTGSTPRQAYLSWCNKTNNSNGFCNESQYTLSYISDTSWLVKQYFSGGQFNNQMPIYRFGDGCAPGASFNPQIGECEAPPECPEPGTSITAAVSCTLAGGLYSYSDVITVDGCEYITAPNGQFKAYPNYDDPSQTFCLASFAASGEASTGGEEVPAEQTAPTPTEDDELPSCLIADGHEFCQDPKQPNCGTRDGNPYCYGETDTCGEVNGQWICFPNGARKCSYANGSYECVNTTTGEKIAHDSADHPDNGGNADGKENNDEQAPGSVIIGGGSQGTSKGATNKSIQDLQQAVETGFDSVTDLLSQENEGPSNGLQEPAEQGAYDLQEWDDKLAVAKTDLKLAVDNFKSLLNGVNSWFISGSGGGLPCIPHEWGELCISDYESQLIGIRYVLLFMAAVLAIYIIFLRD